MTDAPIHTEFQLVLKCLRSFGSFIRNSHSLRAIHSLTQSARNVVAHPLGGTIHPTAAWPG
jgi:hypothetical protein